MYRDFVLLAAATTIFVLISYISTFRGPMNVSNTKTDTSLSQPAPKYTIGAAETESKRYTVLSSLLFAPRYDKKYGLKNTFPRLSPVESNLLNVHRTWKMDSIDARLKVSDHFC